MFGDLRRAAVDFCEWIVRDKLTDRVARERNWQGGYRGREGPDEEQAWAMVLQASLTEFKVSFIDARH